MTSTAVVDGFNRLMGMLDGPMVIVTTISRGGERSGCLVGFSTQASMDPPRYLVFLSSKNHTFGVAEQADVLAVHLVPRAAHDLAAQFGSETGDAVDKFAGCDWHAGIQGVPLLDGCPDRFVGRILARGTDVVDDPGPGGDHVPFLLEPIDASDDSHPSDRERLRLSDVSDLDPGHEA